VWVSRKHFRRLELRVDYTAASRVYKEVIVEKKKGWLMVVCEGACKQKQTCAMRQNQSSAHTAATDTNTERERERERERDVAALLEWRVFCCALFEDLPENLEDRRR
jgi:hypothetical protein